MRRDNKYKNELYFVKQILLVYLLCSYIFEVHMCISMWLCSKWHVLYFSTFIQYCLVCLECTIGREKEYVKCQNVTTALVDYIVWHCHAELIGLVVVVATNSIESSECV